MLQRVFIPGLFVAMLFSAPAFAITAKEKMETCKFGADDQKLSGAARNSFMSKCMANGDAPAAKKPKQQSMQQPVGQPPMQQQK
jgi:psiF repeat